MGSVYDRTAHGSATFGQRSRVPEVTSCLGCIASAGRNTQHGGMHEFFRELRQPMNRAGLFTLAAVALSLRFLPLPQLIIAAALLAAFTVLFVVISAAPERWQLAAGGWQ